MHLEHYVGVVIVLTHGGREVNIDNICTEAGAGNDELPVHRLFTFVYNILCMCVYCVEHKYTSINFVREL